MIAFVLSYPVNVEGAFFFKDTEKGTDNPYSYHCFLQFFQLWEARKFKEVCYKMITLPERVTKKHC